MLSGSKYMLECIVGVGFGKCLLSLVSLESHI